ncbi:MAG: hypothetical protein ACRC1D_01175 [Culicoidibacterales bacterium]
MTPEQPYQHRYTKLRQERVRSGICRDCGKVPPIESKVICKSCSKKRNDFSREHKQKRKVNGLCTRCGKLHNRNKMLCENCNEKQIEDYRQRRKINKIKVVEYFGGKCCECGESDIRTLSVDHTENNGNVDCLGKNGKRIISPTWYARLVKMIDDKTISSQKLQLLCFNCHAKKDLSPWWYNDS